MTTRVCIRFMAGLAWDVTGIGAIVGHRIAVVRRAQEVLLDILLSDYYPAIVRQSVLQSVPGGMDDKGQAERAMTTVSPALRLVRLNGRRCIHVGQASI